MNEQANFRSADSLNKAEAWRLKCEAALARYPDHCPKVGVPVWEGATFAWKCTEFPNQCSCTWWMDREAFEMCLKLFCEAHR
jgi:hypothetical protein